MPGKLINKLTHCYQFFSQTNIFPGSSNPFSIKPTVAQIKVSKKTSIFPGLNLQTYFTTGKILQNFEGQDN